MPRPPSYQAQRPILVRAPLHADLSIPQLPDLREDGHAAAAARRTWLEEVWADDRFAEAVRHASPSLGSTIDTLAGARTADDPAVRQAVRALAGYALRAVHRPTPFGLFAGIAEGSFGEAARADWGTGHTVVASAGAQWMADIVDRLAQDPEVRTRVSVVASNGARVSGSRLVVPWRRRRKGEDDSAVRYTTLRHTEVVRALLALTASPLPYREAVGKAAAESGCDAGQTAAVLDQLIEQHAVLTMLTPPTTVTDQLGHLRTVLRDAGVHPSAAKGLAGALQDIGGVLEQHNRPGCRVEEARELRTRLRKRMLPWSPVSDQLDLDVRLDADVTLPRAVAWEAERAAGLVARLSAEPDGTAAWTRYRRRIADRYGPGVLVPVADLLDPATGLGLPEDFHGTPRAPAPGLSHRDAVLMAHAQQAAAEHRELVLDEVLINELTRDHPVATGPATLELKTSIHAASKQDLDAGRFTLLIDRVSRGWGHFSGGRFARLLHHRSPAMPGGLLATLMDRPTATRGAVPAQLAYPGLQRSHPVVTTTPRLGPDLITLSEPSAPADITAPPIALDDLAVLLDPAADRLHLVRISTRRIIEAFTPHPLQWEFLTPTVGRFLDELTRGQAARVTDTFGVLSTWDWGAARLLPHQPRVRAGRTILSPATWDLSHAQLPNTNTSGRHWDDAFRALRERWAIPDRVHVQWFDQRRTLNLTDATHRTLLREELTRDRPAGRAQLIEAEPAEAYGWCGGRPHEIVTLLASRTQAPEPAAVRTAPVARRSDVGMPGASAYLRVRLHTGHPQIHPLLTEHVPDLMADLDGPAWWAARDDDYPGRAELTIRMPSPETAAPALGVVGRWAEVLTRTGVLSSLAVLPYRPRPGIWGEGPVMTAAENVLAADTACTVHQHAHVTGEDPRVLAALNVLAITAGLTGSHRAGLTWIVAQPKPAATQPLARALDQATRARVHTQPLVDSLSVLPGGRRLVNQLWPQRDTALLAYATQLSESDRCRDTVLHELVRAHLRLALHSSADRATAWRLARSAALGHLATAQEMECDQ
ncbi:lantibiotic dehydratase [Streptomyces sp. MMBL 11-1]|uniref:lantibiotic dehydratase n=1 Tax=Streptomyces sp. MMBL 11-1 TaxID=3026420 RepID=UPI0023605597|nr:lantibiotic dehydratase [Streptomyces sp. MMBL 11-1]